MLLSAWGLRNSDTLGCKVWVDDVVTEMVCEVDATRQWEVSALQSLVQAAPSGAQLPQAVVITIFQAWQTRHQQDSFDIFS